MAPNGSINNSVYVNPFNPGRGADGGRRSRPRAARSQSTDLAELDTEDGEEVQIAKHRRNRIHQVTDAY
jgi:hypothetical protein